MTERVVTYLQVRLTTHDKERIKARAQATGLNTSQYVRRRALGEYFPPRQKRSSPYVVAEAEQLERNIRGSVGMQASRNEP